MIQFAFFNPFDTEPKTEKETPVLSTFEFLRQRFSLLLSQEMLSKIPVTERIHSGTLSFNFFISVLQT